MKIRNGFVSNSSSSSFIIRKENLTAYQLILIKNHIEIDKEQNMKCGCYNKDAILNFQWFIEENDFQVEGSVDMNNFNMKKFLKIIGINPDDVTWEYGG